MLAKGRSADEGGVAKAHLHVLGSFFVVCSIALDQSANTSQEPVCPLPFLGQAQFGDGPQTQYVFFKSLRCPDTNVDHLKNTYEKVAEIERSHTCSLEGRICPHVVFWGPGRRVCCIALAHEDGRPAVWQAHLKISLFLWVYVQP